MEIIRLLIEINSLHHFHLGQRDPGRVNWPRTQALAFLQNWTDHRMSFLSTPLPSLPHDVPVQITRGARKRVIKEK
jgi:hypothetical protein